MLICDDLLLLLIVAAAVLVGGAGRVYHAIHARARFVSLVTSLPLIVRLLRVIVADHIAGGTRIGMQSI